MFNIPDITAYPLDRAEEVLRDNNLNYYVKKNFIDDSLSYFLKPKTGSQYYRVIRQVMKEDVVELIIAPECY